MNKEKLKEYLRAMVHQALNGGFVGEQSLDQFANDVIEIAKKENENRSTEELINAIKQNSKEKGLEAKVTIEYN